MKILFIILIFSFCVAGSCNKKTGEVTIKLDGRCFDPDGTIVSRHWRVISAPGSVTIQSPDKDTTAAMGVPVKGNYVFELAGTDNNGVTRYDTTVKTYK